jgi:hypothetical protein
MHLAAQKERGEVRIKEMEDEDEGRLEVIPTYSLHGAESFLKS